MDFLTALPPSILIHLINDKISHAIPYIILVINFVLFKFLRRLSNRSLANYLSSKSQNRYFTRKARLFKLFIDELISTCELCADCAELNVVYERHGSIAYGLSLFVLSYLWVESFGDAHTTPAYMVEDYFFAAGGQQMLKTGDTYARFVGQSMAMPLAWRVASFYWKYKLLTEHEEFLETENCKTSLTTSTINGFLIEFGCCLICRLIELVGHKLHGDNRISQRVVSFIISFGGTVLVVMALELSGGYFNPVLAASLEYGCRGIQLYQHAVVFWLGPLLGHLVARALYKQYGDQVFRLSGLQQVAKRTKKSVERDTTSSQSRRLTRSNSNKLK